MTRSISEDRGAPDGHGGATAQQALDADDDGGIEILIREIGPNQHSMVATATFDQPVARVWTHFRDFEKLVAVAFPGLASDFAWLSGGSPDRVPSRFQFVAGGERLVEEIYHRSEDQYVLRYRLLEPALGILEYDAELRLAPISDEQTVYTATRTVTLEPGAIDGLAGMLALETQNMQDHFAKRP